MSLEEIRETALSAGAGFAVLAEHDQGLDWERVGEYRSEAERLSDREFMFIAGIEYDFDGSHLVLAGAPGYRRWNGIEEFLTGAAEGGGITVWAHPRPDQLVALRAYAGRLHGMEVWSARYGCPHLPSPALAAVLAGLRRGNPGFWAFAGQDAHRPEQIRTLFLDVEVDAPAPGLVVEALRKGRFCARKGRVEMTSRGTVTGIWSPVRSAAYAAYRLLDRLNP